MPCHSLEIHICTDWYPWQQIQYNINKTTMKHTEEISEMLNKYNKEESLLDELLNDKNNSLKHNIETEVSPEKKLVNVTLEEAVKRNKEIIQELELAKGRLRSKAIFSPMEIQWESICRRYQDTPSLSVTTWKCHLPVFV